MTDPVAQPMPHVGPVPDGEHRPFWSVMIPCFNGGSLLARALESVMGQDVEPDLMQIEVVDDYSTTDDPGEVVRELGGGRVGYFRQPQNVGAPANFTTCARRARGHCVHILHCDDLVRPGFYERYRGQIEMCPDAVMVAGQTIATDAAERWLAVTSPVEVDGGYMRDPQFTIATTNPLRCSAVVVSRAAYEKVGGFHPRLAHANDWEMWARVASSGPVAWIGEPLGLYRSHADSDTSRLHQATSYLDDCLQAVAAIGARLEEGERRANALRAGRRLVSAYAADVGIELALQHKRRLALANAWRGLRIHPSAHTVACLVEVAGRVASGGWPTITKRSGRASEPKAPPAST